MPRDGFDARAATWDDDPHRQALAAAIVAGIRAALPLAQSDRLLDIGCGTGLVGLALAPVVGATLGIDLAPAMVDRFAAKARAAGLAARAEVRDLVADPLPPAAVDVAVSAMAFHHVDDVAALLVAARAALAPGGRLAIADLEAEDGSFHDHPVPHAGFVPEAIAQLVRQAGFADVTHRRVHVIRRADRPRGYPVFLVTGRAS